MHSTALLVPRPPREHLRRLAHWMRALVLLGAVALLAGSGATALNLHDSVLQAAREWLPAARGDAVFTVSAEVRAYALLALALGLALALFALWQLWHLFGAYGRGDVFGPQAGLRLRRLAWALMVAALWRPLNKTVAALLLTWHNPPGQRQLVLSLGWDDYLSLLFGLLLLAMSWAMAEARRIEQDNAGFV